MVKSEMQKMAKRIKALETDMEGARVLLERQMKIIAEMTVVVDLHQKLFLKATGGGDEPLIITPN